MFNFTTQNVLNSVLVGKVGGQNPTFTKDSNVIVSEGARGPVVRIGNVRFNKSNVLDVQIKRHSPESLAKVTFDLANAFTAAGATAEEAGTYRFAFYIGLSMSSQDSLYANDLVYKGKPLYIEFSVKKDDTATAVAKRVVTVAKKYMLLAFDEPILSVSNDGTEVTFEAVNGYQILKKAALQWFNPDAETVDCCTTQGEYEDVIVGIPAVFTLDNNKMVTIGDSPKYLNEDGEQVAYGEKEVPIIPGAEAFGDYNWMIHNLRLPTLANTNIWAPTKQEQPSVGATYDQIIVRMISAVDGIAGQVVGQRATSVTTHVFYVNSTYTDTLITELDKVITDADKQKFTDAETELAAPYNNATIYDWSNDSKHSAQEPND